MNPLPVVLGTVQLGGSYGVANTTGQPDYITAVAMIEAALEGGITCFDTAAAYGESELVLGRALRDLGSPAVTVITKVQPSLGLELSRAVEASAERLGLDCIPTVLFHREPDPSEWEALVGLRDRGLAERVGVSVGHDPLIAAAWVHEPDMAVIQVPASVLDARNTDVFADAATSGVEAHVRSVFLQGLLLMPEAEIPAALSAVVPVRRALSMLASEAGISLAELAVRYVLGLPGDIHVVLGCETVSQVRENARLAVRGPLELDLQERVKSAVPTLPDEVLIPGMWQQL